MDQSTRASRSSETMKITELARGAPCMAQTEVCNHDSETVVWAHLNDSFAGHGMGKKSHDALGFLSCSACHDLYDGRRGMLPRAVKRAIGYEALARTYAHLLDAGKIQITVTKGARA